MIKYTDYTLIKTYVADGTGLTDEQLEKADIDNDGAVDAFDLFIVDKIINGLY